MKGFGEFVLFLLVAIVWTATDWLSRHAQSVLFTVGLICITIGAAMERPSLAFIIPGGVVCGLLVLGRLLAIRAVSQQGGKQDA